VNIFTIIVITGFAGMIIAILLLGLYHPKSGAEILDWKPTRSVELEVQNDIDDLDQMVAAQNALRARHGKAPRNEEDIEAEVRRHKREMDEYAERYWADQAKLGHKPDKRDL
jgi:predicted  nucleic acid-binding Zn-ribbon protein